MPMKIVSSQPSAATPTRCRATGLFQITASAAPTSQTARKGICGTSPTSVTRMPLHTHPAASATASAPRDPVNIAAIIEPADHSIMPAAKSPAR